MRPAFSLPERGGWLSRRRSRVGAARRPIDDLTCFDPCDPAEPPHPVADATTLPQRGGRTPPRVPLFFHLSPHHPRACPEGPDSRCFTAKTGRLDPRHKGEDDEKRSAANASAGTNPRLNSPLAKPHLDFLARAPARAILHGSRRTGGLAWPATLRAAGADGAGAAGSCPSRRSWAWLRIERVEGDTRSVQGRGRSPACPPQA